MSRRKRTPATITLANPADARRFSPGQAVTYASGTSALKRLYPQNVITGINYSNATITFAAPKPEVGEVWLLDGKYLLVIGHAPGRVDDLDANDNWVAWSSDPVIPMVVDIELGNDKPFLRESHHFVRRGQRVA